MCPTCQVEFEAPPSADHSCGTRGIRVFDRLTIVAGRRFGKSKVGSIACVEEATIPNSIIWAAAPTNPKLHRYIIPAFQQLIPASWVKSWNSEFLDLRLTNNTLIHFQTLEDPDQGRGQGLDFLWIDEVSELSRKHWDVISPSLVDRKGGAIFTTSPRGYDWVYDDLYRPAAENVPGYWAAHCKTSDNPIISSEYLEREKLRLSPEMYAQEYLADFVVFTGAVYGAAVDPQVLRTDEEICRILPEWQGTTDSISPHRQVLVGLDTGADHPFGAVKAITTEKGIIIVGEYLQRDKSFIEHAGAIKRLAASEKAKYYINRNERQGMLELAQHGIFCQGSENDIVAGTERVKSWLHTKQLFILSSCQQTLKQLKSYRWAENTAKDESKRTEKVYKREDELPDCLRYMLMGYPLLPQVAAPIGSGRDLSLLPENMRRDIERIRATEKVASIDKLDTVGDFYL